MKKAILSMLLLALTTFAASTFNANAAKNAAFPTTNEVAQPTNTQAVVRRTAFIIGGQKVIFFYQDDYPFASEEQYSNWLDKNGLDYGNGGYISGYFYFTTNGAKKKYEFRGSGGMNQGWTWERGLVYLNGKKIGNYGYGGNEGTHGKGSLTIGGKKYTLRTAKILSM